jgi:hypothetical protein
VLIHAIGYGKRRDDVNAIATVRLKRIHEVIDMILPEFTTSPSQIGPNAWSIFKFINDPLSFCLTIPVAAGICAKLIPSWGGFIGWVAFMLSIPAWWFLCRADGGFFSPAASAARGISIPCVTARGITAHVSLPKTRSPMSASAEHLPALGRSLRPDGPFLFRGAGTAHHPHQRKTKTGSRAL